MASITNNTSSAETSRRLETRSGILHLTTIDSEFDVTRDIALGPHCFIGRDEVFPEWQSLYFAEPFPDEPTMEITEKNLRGLVNHFLPSLADNLNAYHGTSYSIDFWRILVLPWLIELVQKAWTSYVRLNQIIDQYGDKPLTVKVCQDDFEWQFDGTVDFLNTMLSDYRFSWWIDSVVVAALAPAGWLLLPSEPISHPVIEPPKEAPRWQANNRYQTILRNIKYYLGYLDIPGLRWGGLFLAAYVNLLPKSPSRIRFSSDPDFHPEPYFPKIFLSELTRLMDATMPESFLDGFPALAQKAQRFPNVSGRLRLGALSFWNEQEKVMAAFALEAGEKRVIIQHGGEYGMLKYNMMFNEMEGKLCTFISWGWAYDEIDDICGHIVPMPSPLHSKLADQHKSRNDSIICEGVGVRLLLDRIHWAFKVNSPVHCCNQSIEFLEKLDDRVRKSVIYRPYARAANDIEFSDTVRKRFPEMPMLEFNLHDAALKCRLVVLYSYSTTLNLSMAANIPTIVYLSPDLMAPRKEAEPFFEPLRRCGVIHDSPAAAAKHLNRIYDDIESWWNGSDVQEARKIWTHQFARTDRFWWWQWLKALAKLRDIG